MALWGTVIGALFGGIPCDRYGRRRTLFWIGILYLLSALGSALAPNPYLFSVARFIGGLGVETIPAAIFCAFVLGVPESPRWLVLRCQNEAEAVLGASVPIGVEPEAEAPPAASGPASGRHVPRHSSPPTEPSEWRSGDEAPQLPSPSPWQTDPARIV